MVLRDGGWHQTCDRTLLGAIGVGAPLFNLNRKRMGAAAPLQPPALHSVRMPLTHPRPHPDRRLIPRLPKRRGMLGSPNVRACSQDVQFDAGQGAGGSTLSCRASRHAGFAYRGIPLGAAGAPASGVPSSLVS